MTLASTLTAHCKFKLKLCPFNKWFLDSSRPQSFVLSNLNFIKIILYFMDGYRPLSDACATHNDCYDCAPIKWTTYNNWQ